MDRDPNPSSPDQQQHSRVDRKTIEKNRRLHMKALFSKLNSLIVPYDPSRDVASVAVQLEEVAKYIKKLQIKLERMKQKKDSLVIVGSTGEKSPNIGIAIAGSKPKPKPSPLVHIDVHEMDSSLEVVLITGLGFQFMFKETIQLLHQQGADVVNATLSIANDTIFHTIHSKIGDEYAPGYAASRISERLKNFIYACNSDDE